MRVCFVVFAFLLVSLCITTARSAEITVERTDNGAAVKIDGQLFTEYVTQSNTKPILWPIVGPTGKRMTREYPMQTVDYETKKDHPHQRSLWFTHGRVNGIDFWSEVPDKKTGAKTGIIQHLEFFKTASGHPAVISTRNAWLSPEGKKVCEDVRTLRFDADADSRWIDFDITIKATDGPVTFGDTKEGSFGMRIPESMNVDTKKGGQIVNSEGQTDQNAWAKRASWVDYHGPVDGETLGIAIFNHPTSFRYPTYWHVRTYGLFAANTFGIHDFVEGSPENAGEYQLPSGDSVTFRFRVYFHRGDEKAGHVAESYAKYSEVK
jgi:hypothetical protein